MKTCSNIPGDDVIGSVETKTARINTNPLPPIDSACLLRGLNEVQIVHGDSVYTLRKTKQDKLILTK